MNARSMSIVEVKCDPVQAPSPSKIAPPVVSILDRRVPVFFCSSRQAACQFVQAYLLGARARWKA